MSYMQGVRDERRDKLDAESQERKKRLDAESQARKERLDAESQARKERLDAESQARKERLDNAQQARMFGTRQASNDRWGSNQYRGEVYPQNDTGIATVSQSLLNDHTSDWILIKNSLNGKIGKYMGGSLDGKPNGHGKAVYSDGSYEGQWINGFGNGHGTLEGNGIRYVGIHKNGKPHGQGTLYMSDGGKYVGEFSEGNASGFGVCTDAKGKVFDGLWRNGEFKGSVADIGLKVVQTTAKVISVFQYLSTVQF